MPEHLMAGPTFEGLEARIERCLAYFVELGEALADMRDLKLYRGQWDTFDAYCWDRWRIGARRAYQLIAAAEVEANLRTICSHTPTNESQYRLLARLPREDQRAVWETALADADGQQPAARAVADLVGRRLAALADDQQLALVQGHEARLAEQTRPLARPVNWPRRLSNAERTLVRLRAEHADVVERFGTDRLARLLTELEELARALGG